MKPEQVSPEQDQLNSDLDQSDSGSESLPLGENPSSEPTSQAEEGAAKLTPNFRSAQRPPTEQAETIRQFLDDALKKTQQRLLASAESQPVPEPQPQPETTERDSEFCEQLFRVDTLEEFSRLLKQTVFDLIDLTWEDLEESMLFLGAFAAYPATMDVSAMQMVTGLRTKQHQEFMKIVTDLGVLHPHPPDRYYFSAPVGQKLNALLSLLEG